MRPRLLGPGLSLVTLASTALLWTGQDSGAFQTSGYPEEIVAGARLAERRCVKCHTLGRVLEAPWVGEEWHETVRTMADKEKSGISESEAQKIEAFLSYWSKHKGGAGKSPESKPGAAASRPAVFGGLAAHPMPASTVYAAAPLAADAALPATLQLSNVSVVVREALVEPAGNGVARAIARVTVDGRQSDLVLARDAAGKFSSEDVTLRSWTIGPHEFRLVLAIYQSKPIMESSSRVDMTLALLVARTSPPLPK